MAIDPIEDAYENAPFADVADFEGLEDRVREVEAAIADGTIVWVPGDQVSAEIEERVRLQR